MTPDNMNGSQGMIDAPSPDSTMDENESIDSDTFAEWFTERHGRTFHSSGAPYFLPSDPDEITRLDLQHEKFKVLLGSNTFGPLAVHLAPAAGRRKRVLDLGSGSGQWVEEMAQEFPHVKFIGVDLVPTGTQYPSENVQLECYDFLEPGGIRLRDESVDAVHARSISFAIPDYNRLLDECFRVLRPNGLFLSAELDLTFQYHRDRNNNGNNHGDHPLTATREVLRRIRSFCEMRGIGRWFSPITIPDLMTAHGFANVTRRAVQTPIGDWMADHRMRTVGHLAQDVALRLGASLRPALLEHGGSVEEVDTLLADSSLEIQNCRGVSVTYHLVHGRRPAH